MARKKGSSSEFQEDADEATADVSVVDEEDEQDQPETVNVTLEQPRAAEPEARISDRTQEEMEGGRKAVEEREAARNKARETDLT